MKDIDKMFESIGNMIVDYEAAQECENPSSYGEICVKCGKCGRVFENGFMVDGGGTTPQEWDE